jgi:hypothetical protein
VNHGADQTFTITANNGYHISGVLVDGISVGPVTSYTCTNVTANHTIAASFALGGVADISVSPVSYDFGNIKVGKLASTTITITNKGTGNLNISRTAIIGTDAKMFSPLLGLATVVKPSKTYSIRVSFNPKSKGLKSSVLRITSNDPDTGTLDIPLSGTGN